MAVEFALPERRPALMAILNVTPDSFSDGGAYVGAKQAIDAGLRFISEGADLVDVGGESTRPGAAPVSVEEEIDRALPVVEGLSRGGVPVSIDTMKAEVARAALEAGAFLVNDVGGLRSPEMLDVVATSKCHVCVMHMLGEPRTMQLSPAYADVVSEVKSFLLERADAALAAGVPRDNIWIDPGIGFGKTLEHNLVLLRDLSVLVEPGFPVLVGVSRKSFLGKLTGDAPASDRFEATLAAQTHAQLQGARIIRAHDVRATRRAIDVIAAIVGT